MLLEEYAFSLKAMIGIGMVKQDLTGLTFSIPTGTTCSSITRREIIRFLRGDYPLSNFEIVNSDVVEPDYDLREKIEDPSIEVTEENREAVDISKSRALLSLWDESARDLKAASKLDFDEETTMMLKKVAANVKKLEEHRLKYERMRREAGTMYPPVN